MSQDLVVQIMYQGIITLLMVSLPSIGIGLLVGLVISIFQAVTQIQEQTLTFVPKLVAVLLVIAFTSPWMISMMIEFTRSLWTNIPAMVK